MRFYVAAAVAAAVLPCVVLATDHLFSVATGRQFSFVVDKGVAMASGRNQYGQLGLGTTATQISPTAVNIPGDSSGVRQIAAGAFHSLFLMESGDVYVAGRNNHGQLGDGSFSNAGGSLKKLSLARVEAVAAGYAHSVFMFADGSGVKAAGLNNHGQLGDGTTDKRPTPVLVLTEAGLHAMEPAAAEAPGVLNETAAPMPAPTPSPTPAPTPVRPVGIAAGYDFTYMLMSTGEVWATGQNLGGQLGLGDRTTRYKAERVSGRSEQVAAGECHGLLKGTDERLYGMGCNFDGQLGDGTTVRKIQPVGSGHEGVKAVAAGGDSSCVAEYQLKCFGSNRQGQIGMGDEAFTTRPALIEEVDLADDMALGDSHSVFLNHDQVVVSGSNTFGELFDGTTNPTRTVNIVRQLFRNNRTTTTDPPTPAPVPGPTMAPTPTPAPVTSAPSPAGAPSPVGAPPTGAPSPQSPPSPAGPTPTSAPSPDVTREPNNYGLPFDLPELPVIIGGAGVSCALCLLLVSCCRTRDPIEDGTASMQLAALEDPNEDFN